MKNLIVVILILVAQVSWAQINQNNKKSPGVVKYDFNTYKGDPIKTGWLFSDSTYRKLYISYKAADTTITYFQKQGERLERIASEFSGLKDEYDQKAEADQTLIMNQQETIGKLNVLLTQSTDDNAKMLKQFWKIGKVRLHKGTTISIGASALLLGYMAGKAF